jgi:methionine synthase II (cobalamin-independent)
VKPTAAPADIHFGELGYAREARTSHQDFLAARHAGTLERETRFQVSLPTPAAVIGAFVIPQDIGRVLPAYEHAMLQELEKICAAVPHRDLAIQWDVCIEMLQWDGRSPMMPPFPGMEQVFAATFRRLGAAVPQGVELGFHLCYGNLDGKHFVEPEDLGKAVSLANLIVGACPRAVNWLHMPVPADRDDPAYFAPLKNLARAAGMELYLGLVHAKDGAEGTMRRMKAAAAFVKDFGIATECGIGRARTPEMAREIMMVHARAAEQWRVAGA